MTWEAWQQRYYDLDRSYRNDGYDDQGAHEKALEVVTLEWGPCPAQVVAGVVPNVSVASFGTCVLTTCALSRQVYRWKCESPECLIRNEVTSGFYGDWWGKGETATAEFWGCSW